ncbi:hypothetical protein DFH09DRAFT_1424387 [Mycena vulgaris]|nr:hypothetical protein DFH09DRAFT_1424387 [Mycena vulgaris]
MPLHLAPCHHLDMPVACAKPLLSFEIVPFQTPALPLELTDQIIDFVAGLKVKKLRANLATCSLVCRAWTRRSRHHFFQNCRLLVHLDNTLLFGKLLRSPSCTIIPYVQTLTMRNNGETFFHQIRDALSLLTNLKSLRLCGWNWDAYGAPPPREFMAGLGSVVELEIDCPNLGDFDHALQMFCALSSLTHLSIRRLKKPKMMCGWRSSPPTFFIPCTPLLATPPQLSSLLIDAPALISILHWLNGAPPCRLTTLEICLPPIDVDDFGPLQQFMQSLSTSLENICLGSSASTLNQAHLERTFQLSAFKNLQTCRFSKLLSERTPLPLDRAISSIVRSITSSSLQNVAFDLDGSRVAGFAFVNWGVLDQFLAEKSRLKSVDFASAKPVRTRSADEDLYTNCARDIRLAFPRLDSMGLLDVQLRR